MATERDGTVRTASLQRDSHMCNRCWRGRDHGLEVHHIKPIAEGGDDSTENTVTLCGTCHREWHHYVEGKMPHEDFVRLPPYVFFIALMRVAPHHDEPELKTEGMQKFWEKMQLLNRQVTGFEERDRKIEKQRKITATREWNQALRTWRKMIKM